MAINRKQLLRYTGAAAAGAALGVFVRGLFCPDPAGETFSKADPGQGHPAGAARLGAAARPRGRRQRVVLAVRRGPGRRVHGLLPGNPEGHLSRRRGERPRASSATPITSTRRGTAGCWSSRIGSCASGCAWSGRADTTVEAGIGVTAAREADYYVMTFDGLNTFSKEEADHQVEASQGKVSIREVIKMPLLNINDVMDEHFHGAPTFLSVDTEGLDLAILKSIDYGRFRPKIICAETLVSSTQEDPARDPRVHGDAGVCRPRRLVREHHLRRLEAALTVGPAGERGDDVVANPRAGASWWLSRSSRAAGLPPSTAGSGRARPRAGHRRRGPHAPAPSLSTRLSDGAAAARRHRDPSPWRKDTVMASPGTNVEAAFEQAKEQYAEWGVDVDAALRPAVDRRDLAALLAGGRRRRLREHRPGARRRPGGHRQLSRQGPHARRAPRRPRQGPVALPRHASPEPPRQLCRDRRPAGRARRARPEHFQRLDRLGEVAADRAWTSTPPSSPTPGRRRLHPGPPRRGHPPVLDRARHRLPPDRRGDRHGAGHRRA